MRRHILMISALLAPLALIACGSSGGGNTGGNGGSNVGGSGTTSTTTTTTTSSTTSTTSSTTTTTMGTGGTGTGGAAGGNCTNASDGAIIQSEDVPGIAADCGKSNIASQDKIQQCIVDGTKPDGGTTGLSDACAGCFADTVKCTISKCLTACISDSNSQGCIDCRAQNCDPAFYACSGLPH